MTLGSEREPHPAGEGALPEVLATRVVYKGRIVTLSVDDIALPGGRAAIREVIDHPGAVVVVALNSAGEVYLVRQYRHAIKRELLELPAGTMEVGEQPIESAKRELREEVGLVAERWTSLGSFYSSPGFLNECLHVFLAQGLTQHEPDPDIDEDLSVVLMPLTELELRRAEIHDAKTLAALHLLPEGHCCGTDARP